MLSRKIQKKYYKKRWKAFQKHLRGFFDTMNPEELHEVRVEIKKLRALLLLYKHSGHKKIAKNFKPVKKIFKSAGLVRGAHVNLQLIEKYNLNNEEFRNEQVRILVHRTGEFCEKRNDFLKEAKKVYKKILPEIHSIKSKDVLRIYSKQEKKISHLFSEYNSADELHSCRKKIKFLLYVYQFLPKRISDKLNINAKYLDHLQESLGKWHDTVLAIELLRTKNHPDKRVLSRVEAQEEKSLQLVKAGASSFSDKVQDKQR